MALVECKHDQSVTDPLQEFQSNMTDVIPDYRASDAHFTMINNLFGFMMMFFFINKEENQQTSVLWQHDTLITFYCCGG